MSPDAGAVWPSPGSIDEVWVAPDDHTLVVVGPRFAATVLHSVEVDESDDEVGLLAQTAFPLEIARWMVESSEQPGFILPGLQWRIEVRLERPLAARAVVDRGPTVAREAGEDPAVQALARLEADLAAARTPARRRRIRMEIQAIRRNPWKARGPLS